MSDSALKGDTWRVVHTAAPGRDTALIVAAGGLANLVAVAGWRRLKQCATCCTPFVDRTRRWCTPHRQRC